PHLRVPRLQPTSPKLPPRPHRARQPQRQNHHPQPRPALCPPPPTRQTQSRMETHPTPPRHLPLDQPPQPPIRGASPGLTDSAPQRPFGCQTVLVSVKAAITYGERSPNSPSNRSEERRVGEAACSRRAPAGAKHESTEEHR